MKGMLCLSSGDWKILYEKYEFTGHHSVSHRKEFYNILSSNLYEYAYKFGLCEGKEIEFEFQFKNVCDTVRLTMPIKQVNTWDSIFGTDYKNYLLNNSNPDTFPKWLFDNYQPPEKKVL